MTPAGDDASFTARRDGYELSTDPARLDLDVVHGFLAASYWAQDIPRDVVARALAGSLCFGLHHASGQVGLARFVTDRATFAYLADVFVLSAHRGQGLATWLVGTALTHPALTGLRRVLLATRDMHALYAKVGFTPLVRPERMMEILDPDVYRKRPGG
ncbi:MAG: GNAT family N-acetyltransferase [Burkholderiales bacterium]